jgi:hypothetical protein
MLENKVDYTVHRSEVDRLLGITITDEQWEVMSSEIESFIAYAIWQEMGNIWEELPNTMEEDSKYN